jgi:uncharacterized protein
MRGPLIASDTGVSILIRATPNASKDAVLGLVARGGEMRLAVKVRAAPHDGAANAAVCRLIAKALGCRPSTVSIAAGLKDRDKTLLMSGARLDDVAAWIDGLGRHGETD